MEWEFALEEEFELKEEFEQEEEYDQDEEMIGDLGHLPLIPSGSLPEPDGDLAGE